MKLARKIIFLILLAGIFLIVSGCVSQQNGNSNGSINTTQQSPPVTPPITEKDRYWVRIDPIQDFKTDSTFNITGSTFLNVTGTTAYPAGTELMFVILEENNDRDVIRTTININGNESGPNLFFYTYDMKGNPPGQYRVIIKDNINFIVKVSRFNITSEIPYYKWIRVNPLGEVHLGDIIPISGTTDLPEGSEIQVRSDIVAHSCTMAIPDKDGLRTYCGGGCRDVGSQQMIKVVSGTDGINTWNSTINTTDWCLNEEFWIGAFAVNWTNVTTGSQSVRFA
jgi:hypothetical protein